MIAGLYVGRLVSQPAVAALESGTALPSPRTVAAFEAVDTSGAAASQAALTGHPSLVFFGFTHCPDVCPTTLALLAGVQKQVVGNEPGLANLKVALISVDPERDTPDKLGQYISAFRGDFIGLTGSTSQISAIAKAFSVASTKVDLGGGNYTVDHSATVFAVDARGRIVAVFTPPLRAEALVRDLRKLAPVMAAASS